MNSTYVGPPGFGAAPESGGSKDVGVNRMQSIAPFPKRLTPAVKQQIVDDFAKFGLEVKKIDKVHRGQAFLRVSYNGNAWTS